jgi:hypothetical protein
MSAFLIDFDWLNRLLDRLLDLRRKDKFNWLFDRFFNRLFDWLLKWVLKWRKNRESDRRQNVFEEFDCELDSRLERFFCDYKWNSIATLLAKRSKLHFAMNWDRKLQKANTVRDLWKKTTYIRNKFVISIIQNVYIIILLTWQWKIAKIIFWWLMMCEQKVLPTK